MIPADHKENIVNGGIAFMRTITEAYGADEGMKLWNAIADTLDPAIKGEILFALLTGHYTGDIRLRGMTQVQVQQGLNKVNIIKLIREVAGNGLKEAKDMADAMFAGSDIKVPMNGHEHHKRQQFIEAFRREGCTV
jgi:hypothetical protein